MSTDYQLVYEQLFDKVPVMLHLLDEKGRITDVNERWANVLGYEKSEVLGRDARDFLTPSSRSFIDAHTNPLFRVEGRITNVPCEVTTKDGTELNVLLNSYGERDASGRIKQTYGVIINLSESKRLQDALSLSDSILSNINNIVLVADKTGRIVYVNPYTETSLGYERGTLLGDGWWKHARRGEADKDRARSAAEASDLQKVNPRSYKNVVYDAEGHAHQYLFKDAKGPDGLVIGVGYDITHREVQREQVSILNERLRFVLNVEKKVLASESWNEVVYQVLTGLKVHIPYLDRISFSVFELKKSRVRFYLLEDNSEYGVSAPAYIPLSSFSSYDLVKDGSYRLIQDLSQIDQLSPSDETVSELGISSYLVMPVIYRGRLVGSLNLGSKDTYAFSQQDIGLIDEIANEIGSSLIRHDLHDKLAEKNRQIEEKNKNITDSIRYASRIQEALFPSKAFNETSIRNESFVIFKPKHIVSGDFFWVNYREDELCFAVADCTGHGVPGAMLSILGFNWLNGACREENVVAPDQILEYIRENHAAAFRTNETDEIRMSEGMSIGICRLKSEQEEVEFAGAGHNMYLLSRSGLKVYKGRRSGIGGAVAENKSFEKYVVAVKPGDQIYITSDGLPDQFGGESNRKFSTDRFEKLLLAVRHESMQKQRDLIEEAFEEWKGELEQTDDICIIGIRI